MQNPLRTVTSLQEDFKALGLIAPEARRSNALSEQTTRQAAPAPAAPKKEAKKPLTEGLVRQKTTRMPSSERAKARASYRANKAQILRGRKVKAKKASFKLRAKKLAKMKGDKTAGPRRRFVLSTGLSKQATMLESISKSKLLFESKQNDRKTLKTLLESFRNVAGLAGVMARKFSIMEDTIALVEADMGLPVEHPDSEYGYIDPSFNAKEGGKEGDATDYAKDAPKGNVTEMGDPEMAEGDEEAAKVAADSAAADGDAMASTSEQDDSAMGDEEDMMGDDEMSAADDAVNDVEFVDDDPCPSDDFEDDDEWGDDDWDEEDDSVLEWSKRHRGEALDMDMARLRLEAEDVAIKLGAGMVTPQQAGSVLQDMAKYLGGAMQSYAELANFVNKYIGQDMPAPVPGAAPLEQSPDKGTQLGATAPETITQAAAN